MAKKPDAATPSAEQEALVKGKTPRNAIMSIGIMAAVVIGGLGFYYELQATNKADEESRVKKASALKSSTEAPAAANNNDIDQMIRQQQEAAASEAAAQAASAAAAPKPAVKPMLTGADFQEEVKGSSTDTRELSRQAAQDAIYTSSIFKQAGASRSANSATGVLPAGLPSLDEVRAARNAAGANTPDAMAIALAKQGQAPEDRDRAFLRDAGSRGGIERTTFNGRSTGCTLTPPHVIHVKTVEGLNSDKPGRVALMVDEDVYDTCGLKPFLAWANRFEGQTVEAAAGGLSVSIDGSPVSLESLFIKAGWLRPANLTDDAQGSIAERRGGWACASAQAPFDVMHASVDPKILAGIALNESAYNGRAWPWTLNVAGRGFFFRTREDAYRAIRYLISNGRSDFDIGLMQVNWGYHSKRFKSAWDALAPATNIRVAEDILNENYRHTHSAVKAVAYYHSANPAPGREYLARFVKHLSQIERGL